MSTVTEPDVINARIVLNPDCPEACDEWRSAINKWLQPELVDGVWHLPDHRLRAEVQASWVPFELHGHLMVEDQVIEWDATLDDFETVPGTIRKRVCVFDVYQV